MKKAVLFLLTEENRNSRHLMVDCVSLCVSSCSIITTEVTSCSNANIGYSAAVAVLQRHNIIGGLPIVQSITFSNKECSLFHLPLSNNSFVLARSRRLFISFHFIFFISYHLRRVALRQKPFFKGPSDKNLITIYN